jgi:hypothetical protein
MRSQVALICLALVGLVACQTETTAPKTMETAEFVNQVAFARGGTCTLANGNTAATGFDQYGYNRCAHNFVGTYGGWCAARGAAADCAGFSGDSRLNMKWTEGWDRGNAQGWSQAPYADAWLDNEAKGTYLDGSIWSEHFKTKWDASCVASGTGSNGEPCIWGQFAILMDQGKGPTGHEWWTRNSTGYGN